MDNEIITKDLYLAAILISYGSQIVKIDKSDVDRQFFHFDRLPEHVFVFEGTEPVRKSVVSLEHLRTFYLSKRLFFPPTFVDSLRSARSCLFGEKP